MGFIGTTAAVAVGGALIPLARLLLRLFGLLIILSLALAYCSDDDGHPTRDRMMPGYAICTGIVQPAPGTVWEVPAQCNSDAKDAVWDGGRQIGR